MPYTPAKGQATIKYQAKALDRLHIAVKKGEKEKYKAHAEAQGESLQAFVIRAMNEAIKNDIKKGQPN